MHFREEWYIILNVTNGEYYEEGNEKYGIKNYRINYG